MRTPKLMCFQGGLLLLLSFPALSQNLDVTVSGGGGFEAVSGITAVGASIGGPHISKHRWQLDYLFHNGYSRDERQRHLLTFSYVRQARSGRARGFLQAGGGIATLRYLDWNPWPPGSPAPQRKNTTGFASLLGGGVTIDVGQSFFIRPEIRLYSHSESVMILLAAVGVGRRF